MSKVRNLRESFSGFDNVDEMKYYESMIDDVDMDWNSLVVAHCIEMLEDALDDVEIVEVNSFVDRIAQMCMAVAVVQQDRVQVDNQDRWDQNNNTTMYDSGLSKMNTIYYCIEIVALDFWQKCDESYLNRCAVSMIEVTTLQNF